MSSTTIRVNRETRDLLTSQARSQGVSVTVLVDRLARANERAEIFREERRLWSQEAEETADEMRDWDETLADGLD
jgi:hypothetical protein